ncbi:MAG: hypothetical protein ACRC7N_19290 [Clostridium sp.]
MSLKKNTIIKISLILALFVIVACGAIMIVTSMDRDIREGKKFIKFLDEKDLIDNKTDIDSIEFIKGKKDKEKSYTTLASKEYGVDLDEDYEVVGFFNKALPLGEVKISKEESIDIANKYLTILYKGEAKLKGFSKEALEEMPFYTIIYSKYVDGYPYYSDEITVSIDKNNGKLAGFTNISTQGYPKESEIVITDDRAKEIAISKFNESFMDGIVDEKITMAYSLKLEQSKNSILCYIVSIRGKQKTDSNDIYYRYFISTENGEVLDSVRDSKRMIKDK